MYNYDIVFLSLHVIGTGWQRTLYHSIDGSRCLLALVTENYIKSPVCQEEYNLALAKHCSGVSLTKGNVTCSDKTLNKSHVTSVSFNTTNQQCRLFHGQ